MIKIHYTGDYYHGLIELLHQNPDLRTTVDTHVEWFCHNPDDTRLRNHKLTGKLSSMLFQLLMMSE